MALKFRALLTAALPALLLAGCGEPANDGPLRVVAIGGEPKLKAAEGAMNLPSQILRISVAQGLVAFDESGHVEPALAQRWVVSDDGLSYIFRLRQAELSDGKPLTAQMLARRIRTMVAHDSKNPLAPLFNPVEQVSAVTPEIIELRLRSPRPQLLPLLAQPEAGLTFGNAGGGPFKMAREEGGSILLTPLAEALDEEEPQQARYAVRLRGDRAAAAVARYDKGYADLVLGGSFADLPYARLIKVPSAQLRFDPAIGLFGLAVERREGFLASAKNREAIAMAIDREALIQTQNISGWRPAYTIVPERLDLASDPAQPGWIGLSREERLTIARQRVAEWSAGQTAFPRVRIALPAGPGSKILFARIAVDLGQIGIIVERAEGDDADLRLIDEVAPHDSASWFLLRLGCGRGLPCSEAGAAALEAARAADTLSARSNQLTNAEVAYLAELPFIPIASPVRWSLVRPKLTGFRTNIRAAHPLNRLLKD